MKTPIIVLLAAGVSACSMSRTASLPSSIPAVKGKTAELFSLRYVEVAAGTGAPAEPRKCLYVHYAGWLTNGTVFDASRNPAPGSPERDPISFPQGQRRVIAGWDMGFEGMRVGGKRRLFIPYQLAYGDAGRLPTIPAKAELIFDVELMAVADVGGGNNCPAWATVRPPSQSRTTTY